MPAEESTRASSPTISPADEEAVKAVLLSTMFDL